MKTVKILCTALAAAAVMAALPAAAQTSNQSSNPSGKMRCIDVKDIRDTMSRDGGQTLTITLNNGTTMVNHLRSPCGSLRFGGFVWVVSPNGDICENVQTLRTLVTGEICRLGKFDAPVKLSSAR